jgi:hypothetical protein
MSMKFKNITIAFVIVLSLLTVASYFFFTAQKTGDENRGYKKETKKELANDKTNVFLFEETVIKIEDKYREDCIDSNHSMEYMWTNFGRLRAEMRWFIECSAIEKRDRSQCSFLKNRSIKDELSGFDECVDSYDIFVNAFLFSIENKEKLNVQHICEDYFYDDDYMTPDNCEHFFSSIGGAKNSCELITVEELKSACNAFNDGNIKLGFDLMSQMEDGERPKDRMKNLYFQLYKGGEVCKDYYKIREKVCSEFDINSLNEELKIKYLEEILEN